MQYFKSQWFGLGFFCLLFGFGAMYAPTEFWASFKPHAKHQNQKIQSSEFSSLAEEDIYQNQVQSVFNNRCVACHSCYNSPCQLNLTSFEGLTRGGHARPLYDPKRANEVPPTRLGIDAQTTDQWRKLGFHDVLASSTGSVQDSILISMIRQRVDYPQVEASTFAENSRTCAAKPEDLNQAMDSRPELGMPYGLPPLSTAEMQSLNSWLAQGAPGPTKESLAKLKQIQNPETKVMISETEKFLNSPEKEQKLVSRYLYEHLFLAHFYFKPTQTKEFFRLVRSKNRCDGSVVEVPTRRPTDHPGVNFFYCFQKINGVMMDKNHIVYEFDRAKLDRWKQIFYSKPWKASYTITWGDSPASNPFVTFQDIPAESRYQFLLDDAEYTVMTFIKGPVCRGSTAVNVINEQFWVMFLDPKSDLFVQNSKYAQSVLEDLRMPGGWGTDMEKIKIFTRTPVMMKIRNDYREKRDEVYFKTRPQGLGLQDIWSGDGGKNMNALLTVLRHHDSAHVVKGAIGPVPKTTFVLDYPLLERLVYDLVVNFDVFGNVTHQTLTRIYKSLIRMEAEELYLSFLPTNVRSPLRDSWYVGKLTEPKMELFYPMIPRDQSRRPNLIEYLNSEASAQDAPAAFFQKVFSGPLKNQYQSLQRQVLPQFQVVLDHAQKIEKTKARDLHFINYLDDVSFLRVIDDVSEPGVDGVSQVFSIVRNKEHHNISWISKEDVRRDKENDTVMVVPGYLTSYPNRFVVVRLSKIESFFANLRQVKSVSDAKLFLQNNGGIFRTNPQFWKHMDWFNQDYLKSNPVHGGQFDLNRYELYADPGI